MKPLRMAAGLLQGSTEATSLEATKPFPDPGTAKSVEAGDRLFLSRDYEESLAQDIVHARMTMCYASIEPTIVRHGVIDSLPTQSRAKDVQLERYKKPRQLKPQPMLMNLTCSWAWTARRMTSRRLSTQGPREYMK